MSKNDQKTGPFLTNPPLLSSFIVESLFALITNVMHEILNAMAYNFFGII